MLCYVMGTDALLQENASGTRYTMGALLQGHASGTRYAVTFMDAGCAAAGAW